VTRVVLLVALPLPLVVELLVEVALRKAHNGSTDAGAAAAVVAFALRLPEAGAFAAPLTGRDASPVSVRPEIMSESPGSVKSDPTPPARSRVAA
jgi:hypothetical protein